MSMTKKASQMEVPRPVALPRGRGISSRPRIEAHTLENLLERFDPKLHGGEVMAWSPLGVEVLP